MKEFFNVTELDKVLEYAADFASVSAETVPLAEARGRVLAEEIRSDADLPGFSRATMDGYAVRAKSTFGASEANPAYLELRGTIAMGETPDFSIGHGEAARISDALRGELADAFPMRPHRCAECELVFLHPYFDAEGERDFYRHAFRRIYHGDAYDLEAFHERGGSEARRRVEALSARGLLRGRVLEVGSATGYFLEAAAQAPEVAEASGAEPDEAQRGFARERGIATRASLEDFAGERFDLIALFHVLEHLRDPVAVLRDLAARLRPGGALAVEVPNLDDALLGAYRIPEFERFYWHPAHACYFSRETLARAARAAGLDARVEPLQRYTLSNHLHWAVRRAPGGQRWLEGLLSPETERAYAADLCRSFRCDTLWMIARPAGQGAR